MTSGRNRNCISRSSIRTKPITSALTPQSDPETIIIGLPLIYIAIAHATESLMLNAITLFHIG